MGVALALRNLRGGRSPRMVAAVHGLVGVAGFAMSLILLQGPRRGDAMGVGSFGAAASVLFGMALFAGVVVMILIRRFPRAAGLAIAVHATLAITGFVLFLAWISIGQLPAPSAG